jgi:hypothetical protein
MDFDRCLIPTVTWQLAPKPRFLRAANHFKNPRRAGSEERVFAG